MPRYLQKRRRRWYATLDIPKALRLKFGGHARFVQSLKTESLTEAERLAPLLVAQWKAELEAVRTGSNRPLQQFRDAAMGWRETLDEANEEDRDGIEMVLQDEAEAAEAKQAGAGVAIYKLATRQWLETKEHVEEWLTTLDNEPKTIDMKRSDLKRFCGRFNLTHKVHRKEVQKWVYELQQVDGLKAPTVRRIISACRMYWSHLQRLDFVQDDIDPFKDVVPKKTRSSKSDVASKRKTFSGHDVARLLDAAIAGPDTQLALLIWLGMWTGCRIEELCALRVDDVSPDRFLITDAKSEAGWREVPVHSNLNPTIQTLCSDSKDGYVLSGLSENKYGDRSNAVGKRFGRLKTRLGFDQSYVYHSIRKTVTTQLDAAGIPEAVSARIIGHDIPTMTYGVYSGGAPFDTKREALEVLRYPLKPNAPETLQALIGKSSR